MHSYDVVVLQMYEDNNTNNKGESTIILNVLEFLRDNTNMSL